MADPMESDLLARFTSLITSRTGLRLRDQDVALLSRSLITRIRKTSAPSSEEYCRLLESESPESEWEWQRLVSLLTNGESYFFRDRAQMRLLKNTVLPDIIRRNASRRTLRIWSAGCSTGEEAYSLAVLLHELLPDFDSWQIFLMATDVDVDALESARRGHYRTWSFRSVDESILQRYFEPTAEGYRVIDSLRRGVVFRYGNLFRDPYPDIVSGIRCFDLILCRNVFIYFDSKAVGVVLHKFADCLNQDGWLVTGHAELHGQTMRNLTPVRYPESVVYRKLNAAVVSHGESVPQCASSLKAAANQPGKTIPIKRKSESREHLHRPATPRRSAGATTLQAEAEEYLSRGAVAKALTLTESAMHNPTERHWALILSAQILADTGRHAEAVQRCHIAIECAPTDARAYLLLAHIAEERGDVTAAKQYLRKVIFLSPGSGEAYRHLAELCERDGATDRARTLRIAAQSTSAGQSGEVSADKPVSVRVQRLVDGIDR